jgi:predicted DCC family thiol-disulfide oxidoreductase YuxK
MVRESNPTVPGDELTLYRAQIEGRDLVLYDGVCALCNGVVRYLLRTDKQDRFRFIPQETPLAEAILRRLPAEMRPVETRPAEGVILVTAALTASERTYRRSDAVSEALRLIGGPLSPLGWLLRLVPRGLQEFGYGLIARYRYRLFGRYSTCPIPTAEQRAKILGVS